MEQSWEKQLHQMNRESSENTDVTGSSSPSAHNALAKETGCPGLDNSRCAADELRGGHDTQTRRVPSLRWDTWGLLWCRSGECRALTAETDMV